MQHADDVATAVESWSYVSVRFTTFISIVVVVGSVVFMRVLIPRLARGGHAALAEELHARVRLLALGASIALLALAVARVALQRAVLTEAFGGDSAVPLGDVLAGAWGVGVALQCVGGVAGLLAFGSRAGAFASGAAGLVALSVAFSPAFSGHAAGEEAPFFPILADAAHVLAAGAWAGTLTALVAVALPTIRQGSDADLRTVISSLLAAFSPIALASATVLAITGGFAAWLHLPTLDSLWTTRYGDALLRKLVLVGAMLVMGAMNWKRFGPSADTPPGATRLARAGWVELALAAAILFASAVLVARGTPADLLE